MKKNQLKCIAFIILYSVGMTAAVCLAAVSFIRKLGSLCGWAGTVLGLEEDILFQVRQALEALQEARIEPPLWITGICCMAGGVLLAVILFPGEKRQGWSICIVAVLIAAILLPLYSLITIWFTDVNSIRFGKVAGSLLQVAVGMEEVHVPQENEPQEKTEKKEFAARTEQSAVTDAGGKRLEASEISVYKDTGAGNFWTVGFGSAEIRPENLRTDPLYIAGYHNDWKTSQYLDNYQLEVYRKINEERERRSYYDYAQARAVWLDAGEGGVLLIGIDGIAVSADYVQEIRERLRELCEKENCISVNVYATHSHALPDTLGLWGPVGMDGKNDAYMKNLVEAAVSAAEQAAADRHAGTLSYSKVATDGEYLLRDSRYPYVYDENLHQIRFEGEDGYGVRLFFYGAHAESMRGANRILSRDFPGVLCDLVTEETGDHTMFLPGAIGGLIMTEELVAPFDAVENMQLTGRILADYALSIKPESEENLEPRLSVAGSKITVPLDNNAFMYYEFLGILKCNAVKGESRTGYAVCSEMSLIRLGDVTIALIPGEIFPELVLGGRYGDASPENSNPEPLQEIAAYYGAEDLLILGLANDELGYIVPPSDFLVNETNPYLEKTEDAGGENHYEETNSVGPECANVIAETFGKLMEALAE